MQCLNSRLCTCSDEFSSVHARLSLRAIGSYMACSWNFKEPKHWLAQSILPRVACTKQSLS